MSIFHSNYNQWKINSWSTQALSIVLWFSKYYAQSIENTKQTVVSAIASSRSTRSCKYIKLWINQFLDYAATHPNAKIRYHSSQMQLWIHSDASYLNEFIASSNNGSLFYLYDKPKPPIKPNDPPPKLNAPVLVNSKIIDTVMSSVQEYETSSSSINGKDDVPLSNYLHEIFHIQGLKPIQFDNIFANSIITNIFVQHRSKAMDMRLYWICDRCRQMFFMFIGNNENKILPTIHQNITPQNITFQFDQSMYSITSKNKQKFYSNYQQHCKGVLK